MTGFKKKKPKKQRSLGTCQFCGSPIYEYSYGWACSNKDCETIIYKDDRFFNIVLKKSMTKSKALTLLTGGKVREKNVYIHGVKHDMDIRLGFDRTGTYPNRYSMSYLDYDFKKDLNYNHSLDSVERGGVTGFDILNGDN